MSGVCACQDTSDKAFACVYMGASSCLWLKYIYLLAYMWIPSCVILPTFKIQVWYLTTCVLAPLSSLIQHCNFTVVHNYYIIVLTSFKSLQSHLHFYYSIFESIAFKYNEDVHTSVCFCLCESVFPSVCADWRFSAVSFSLHPVYRQYVRYFILKSNPTKIILSYRI